MKKKRGEFIDFAAGGTASFIRLRPSKTHAGATLEAWSQDQALIEEPGDPIYPLWTGEVGADQLYRLATACLRLLGHELVAQSLHKTSWPLTDDQRAIRQYLLEYGTHSP